MAEDKVAALGRVTTKTSRIEPLGQIDARLREASSLAGTGRLALSRRVLVLVGYAGIRAGR